MASMSTLAVLAEEASHVVLPMPTWAYGAIALAAFAFLGFVVFSFRDVYHRHEDSERSAAESAGHGE